MAIDQRDVSSTLRFMDDRALQQYAAMHKNDPYIFPLAFQESQNRQKIRMSQQTAQGMQPQPKVADQALAQMAPQPMPEEQGIGALPADNMQQMADGGIAGYDDDANFAARSEPVVMMAGGGQVPRYNGTQGSVTNSRPQFIQDIMGIPQMYTDYQQRIREEDERKAESDRRMAQRRQEQLAARQKTSFSNYLFGSPAAEAEGKAQLAQMSGPTPEQQQAEFIRQQDKLMKGRTPRRQGDEFEAEEKMAADRAAKPPVVDPSAKAGPRADTKRKDTERKDNERKDPSAKTETGGLDSLVNKYTRAIDLGIGANKNARVELAADVEQIPKDRAERNAKERAKEGDVFAGREARLAEREKGIAGMGDKYMGLALLQAGAAMMSTPGNIGSVLGKGIAVGSERYIAGIDKINAAKDKFAEARDRLEDLRLNRADMTKKEVREDQRAIDDGILQAKKLLVDGATNDLKISTDAQTKIFGAVTDNLKTDKLIAGRSADTQALIAARGDTAGTKQARLQLDSLKAQAANISNELKDPMLGLPRNAAIKQAKQAELARINSQMNQIAGLSTMAPASPVGTSSGVQFLGYE
jgi:hypothetical protein